MIRHIILLTVGLLCVHSLWAQNTMLKQSVADLRNDPYMLQGRWGLVVINGTTGLTIEEYNADSLFIPASIVKLVTTSTALEVAGDSFRYTTKVWMTGQIDESGTLQGDVWIEGGGDPTIGMDFFSSGRFIDSLYNALSRQGIHAIHGNMYGLATAFDSLIIPDTYPEDDFGNYYGAGTSALIWDGNRMMLSFVTPAAFGSATKLNSFFPPFDNFVLDNKATSGRSGTGDNSIVYGGPFEFSRRIEGSLPPAKSDFRVYGSSPDPALGFVLAVKFQLEKKGLFADGQCFSRYTGSVPNTAKPLLTHQSVTLGEIINFTNTNSHNATAETMLKTAGMLKSGIGTYASGLSQVNQLLTEMKVPSGGMQLHDGCGLSKANQMSPRAMGTFLLNIRQKSWYPKLYGSMPLAGKTGTLSSMFQGTSVQGKLRAKSGYMKTVRAYAGYVENQKGDMMVFCVIVNNYSGNAFALKKKLENLMISVSFAE